MSTRTTNAPRIDQFEDDEQRLFESLYAQLVSKRPRNEIRAAYYDGKNALRQVGMSLPPSFSTVATVLGWPAKAVDGLANRVTFQGFTAAGLDLESLGVSEIEAENSLDAEASQAGTSAIIHSVSWLTVTQGIDGEPDVVIAARDAMSGTGIWDRRRRCLSSFLSVIDTDDGNRPTNLAIYTPDRVLTAVKDGSGWTVEKSDHSLGRVPVQPLVLKPRLGRPFGSSRISRPVMSITDLAMRTVMRSEITAELYSIPQRVILGSDDSTFRNPDGTPNDKWHYVVGKVIGIPRDEDGDLPVLQQMQQASQQPHMDQLRSLAKLFAGETSIPESSLGISAEANPVSAEAYYASREDLIGLAEQTARDWTPAWRNTIITALQLREKLDTIPADWLRIKPTWRNPAHTSQGAAVDAMTKLVALFPWMSESQVTLEMAQMDPDLVERLWADKRRFGSRSLAESLALAAQGVTPDAAA